MDIIEAIDSVLAEALAPKSITSFYGWYDENINDTHVTFTLINDNDSDFSEDDAETNVQQVQVDIWSQSNMEELKQVIKTAMKTIENCTYNTGQDFYETETKIYHKALRFDILQELI